MPTLSNTEAAPQIGGLVFFGDSGSDPGNLFALTEGLINKENLSIGGPNGEVSDGPTHPTYTALALGVSETYNYAIAAAEAARTQTLGELLAPGGRLIVPTDDPRLGYDINLGAQIDRYLADFDGQDLSGTRAVIQIGSNDFLAIQPGTLPEVLASAFAIQTQAIAATLDAATELLLGGVGSVAVYSLLDPAFFPTYATTAETRKLTVALFDSYNLVMAEGIENLQATGLDVRMIDLSVITDAMINDAASFGFVAPANLTLTAGDPLQLADYDADQVVFWDEFHLGTATHGVIGAFAAFAQVKSPVVLGEGDDASMADDGDDLAFAYGGADTVEAGSGADSVFGGSGTDTIRGASGDDQLSGGSDADWLHGGMDQDVLVGDGGDDVLRGGAGRDVLIDGLGQDTIMGSYGDDTFIFIEPSLIGGTQAAADIFCSRFGHDTLYLALGAETYLAAQSLTTAQLLDALNVTALGVEEVIVVQGRAGLAGLSGEDWYDSADLWGLI